MSRARDGSPARVHRMCFLDERTTRGRRWTCTVSPTSESVRCKTRNRRVTWRIPS